MIVLLQHIPLFQFAIWGHFATLTSKIILYLFPQAVHKQSIHALFVPFNFKFILAIFLKAFFFDKTKSFDNTVLTILTFFMPLRSISFHSCTYKSKMLSSDFTHFSMLIKPLPSCFSMLITFFNANQTSSINVTIWIQGPILHESLSCRSVHFFQLIHLLINTSSSVS